MRTSSVGALLLLGLMLTIFVVGMRNRRAGKDLIAYLRTAGFRNGPCPVAEPFTYTDMTQVDCYSGELRAAVPTPVNLMLGRRRGTPVMVNGAPIPTMEDYISLYLAPAAAAKLGPEWLARWQPDLDARGKQPMRVTRTAEGGIVLTWRSPHDQSTVEARLAAVRQALP